MNRYIFPLDFVNKVQAKRLLKLCGHLRTVKKPTFDMGAFVDTRFEDEDACEQKESTKTPPCGTTCCAAGHAGLMPEFRKLGFKTDFISEGVSFEDKCGGFDIGFDACEIFFGDNQIFDPSDYQQYGLKCESPKQVAKHIENAVYNKYPTLNPKGAKLP